ncbi:hypothetical protein B566_EDAN003186 [Ephemera danica]|nr:hypothetical protein B566_EDAN003186 [Ephemera danica]
MNPFDLAGKAILVLGASSGIGASTALALGRAGAKVALASRRAEAMQDLAAQIQAAGGTALVIPADVNVEADVARAVAKTVETFGRLDGAFNNAGISGRSGPLKDMTQADFNAVMNTNVQGVFLAMKHEIAAMLKTGGGAIVNTASNLAHVAYPNMSAYNASKHAVLGLTRTAALENYLSGIRINAVSPGPIETPLTEAEFGGLDNLRAAFKETPAGRPGMPDEIAFPVLFLLSSAASYISGQSLIVDGGLSVE